ncbi:hypothetical protein HOLleu_33772 [Holothuria leucospilota]|uniref:Uncharacterized protein n=1 Tax=Holothuria leucospilota TaxID=206669 RepID=A0A9Q0YPA0_HOLLE|nr:hypothetical protein HOLleu_33772 [Holothuria leucospilota]
MARSVGSTTVWLDLVVPVAGFVGTWVGFLGTYDWIVRTMVGFGGTYSMARFIDTMVEFGGIYVLLGLLIHGMDLVVPMAGLFVLWLNVVVPAVWLGLLIPWLVLEKEVDKVNSTVTCVLKSSQGNVPKTFSRVELNTNLHQPPSNWLKSGTPIDARNTWVRGGSGYFSS